jgi:hypothetical protein
MNFKLIGTTTDEVRINWVMTLRKLIVVTAANGPQEAAINIATLAVLALPLYQLGLFIFTKTIY